MTKRRFNYSSSVLVIAAVGGIIWASAGNLNPPAGSVTPTMKTLAEVEPRIAVNETNTPGGDSTVFKIGQSGSYYLTGNVIVAADGTGLAIKADDVTVDLAGFAFIGMPGSKGGSGISLVNVSNVEIRNGTVRDFGESGIGASSTASRNHRIIDIRAISNGGHGIFLNGEHHLVKDCSAEGNSLDGIHVGTGCIVTGNTANENHLAGITADPDSLVTGNIARNNLDHGIHVFGGSIVSGNTTSGNSFSGINARGACTITGNSARNNQTRGIFADIGSTVTGNNAFFNQNDGISLGGQNLVDQNTAFSNNRSVGGFVDIDACGTCTFGLNHTP